MVSNDLTLVSRGSAAAKNVTAIAKNPASSARKVTATSKSVTEGGKNASKIGTIVTTRAKNLQGPKNRGRSATEVPVGVVPSGMVGFATSVVASFSDAPLTPCAQIDATSGDPNFMTSLARGLTVIQAFSQRRRHLTVSQISNRTGISRAAVRRCLYTLSKLGFAGSDDGRQFYLRARVLGLGHSYVSSMPLAAAAQPILEHVSHILHESCSIATLDGSDIVYIARANVTRIMAIDLRVGSRLPAFCTSMGRVLLADLLPDKLEEYLARVTLKPLTGRTVANVEKLRQILKMIQRNGYSIVDQELELGLRSMAVPLRNPDGKVVAALNVGTQAQRVSIQDLQTRFLPHLQMAAQELGVLLK